jgi:hypothetical protein
MAGERLAPVVVGEAVAITKASWRSRGGQDFGYRP